MSGLDPENVAFLNFLLSAARLGVKVLIAYWIWTIVVDGWRGWKGLPPIRRPWWW